MSLKGDSVIFHNGEEEVVLGISYKGDSFYVDIPNFESHLEGVVQSENVFKGVYVKDYTEDYSIPFIATKSDSALFNSGKGSYLKVKPKYDVSIYNGSKETKAIGVFDQSNNHVSASFATETGDYRFLEGIINDTLLSMSKFDGSSLQLFTATVKNDSLINGVFISGKGGYYTWNGISAPDVTLRNPEKLTRLKEGYDTMDFSFIDLDGNPVSLADKRFKNKIKIIQITGTWCPNCLDETRYFKELYDKYNKDGLEIIAVAFEHGNDTLAVLDKLKRYKENNEIAYSMLYGGKSSSKDASAAFPMLNSIMSFPTAIYLNRDNEVEKIYTGFYGPGTGEYFVEYTQETEKFISELLKNAN
jgi:thiol-disulfide isomerase/thioredoxin